MKEKYFNVNELYVGCLGTVKDNYWSKLKLNPYIAFRYIDGKSNDYHEAKNVFSDEEYYFFREAKRVKSFDDADKKKYITSIKPIVYDKEKISSVELKSILCHLNILEYLISNKDDCYLQMLNRCLNDIDLMGDGKVKEYYMDEISSLINRYCSVINSDNKEDIISDINTIRHELDREREIAVKKRIKLK